MTGATWWKTWQCCAFGKKRKSAALPGIDCGDAKALGLKHHCTSCKGQSEKSSFELAGPVLMKAWVMEAGSESGQHARNPFSTGTCRRMRYACFHASDRFILLAGPDIAKAHPGQSRPLDKLTIQVLLRKAAISVQGVCPQVKDAPRGQNMHKTGLLDGNSG